METTRAKRPLYLLIASATIGLFFVLYWMLSENTPNLEEKPRSTINILSNKESLPPQCVQTLDVLNCVITSTETKDKESINQYYQRIVSEWNLIIDQKILVNDCTKQYEYLLSITDPSYQKTIALCNK